MLAAHRRVTFAARRGLPQLWRQTDFGAENVLKFENTLTMVFMNILITIFNNIITKIFLKTEINKIGVLFLSGIIKNEFPILRCQNHFLIC